MQNVRDISEAATTVEPSVTATSPTSNSASTWALWDEAKLSTIDTPSCCREDIDVFLPTLSKTQLISLRLLRPDIKGIKTFPTTKLASTTHFTYSLIEEHLIFPHCYIKKCRNTFLVLFPDQSWIRLINKMRLGFKSHRNGSIRNRTF